MTLMGISMPQAIRSYFRVGFNYFFPNLIPFNSFPGTEYTCSEADVIRRFCMKLRASGIVATIRRTRGDDISAACGQLAGQVKNRMLVRLGNRKIRAAC